MLMNYIMVPLIHLFCHSGSSTERSPVMNQSSSLQIQSLKAKDSKNSSSRTTGDSDLRGHVSDDELQRLVTVIEVSG